MGRHTARGQGSIIYRADKQCYQGYVTFNGKRHYVYAKKQQEASMKLDELKARLRSGEYNNPNSLTVGAWIANWSRDYLPAKKEGTRLKYERDMRLYIMPELGSKKLTDLRQGDIQRACIRLMARVSPKTITNAINTFHEILETAVDNDLLRKNPCRKITIPKGKKKEMEILTAKELEQFLQMAKADPYNDFFLIGAYTGMRKGELLGLTWDCIDFKRKTIRVYRQLIYSPSKKQYTFDTPKTQASERTFTAPDEVFDVLRTIQERQKNWKRIFGRQWKDRNGLVFTHEDGTNYAGQTVYHHYKEIAKAIGRPTLRLHDLRHTFASLTVQGGGGYKALSHQLGHSSITITLDRYAHTTPEMMEQNANAITEVMRKCKADT